MELTDPKPISPAVAPVAAKPSRQALPSHLLARLWISLLTVITTLLLIEMLVRAIPFYPENLSMYDPMIGTVFMPDASGVQVNPMCLGAYRQSVQINPHGLLDDDLPYAHGEKYRILFLGDSFLESRQVPLADTFHVLLERKLGVEVIAGGHGGWGTDNELLWYRQEGHQYHADLVVLLYQPENDVQDNSATINIVPDQYPHFTLEEGRLALHTAPVEISPVAPHADTLSTNLHTFFLDHSRLYDLIVIRLRRRQITSSNPPQAGQDDLYEQLYDDAFELTLALVDQLRRETAEEGSDFVVALASSDVRVLFGGDTGLERAALAALGIDFVDLLPAIQAANTPDNPMHLPCDGHWTLNAHLLVADLLGEYLRTRLRIEVP